MIVAMMILILKLEINNIGDSTSVSDGSSSSSNNNVDSINNNINNNNIGDIDNNNSVNLRKEGDKRDRYKSNGIY